MSQNSTDCTTPTSNRKILQQQVIDQSGFYVVCVDYYWDDHNIKIADFRAILRRCRDTFTVAQWGYTDPAHEYVMEKPDDALPATTGVNKLNALLLAFGGYTKTVFRSYWAFKDEVDALQFRLLVGERAKHVHMWSAQLRFTMYTY